jgi:hypothetical protein
VVRKYSILRCFPRIGSFRARYVAPRHAVCGTRAAVNRAPQRAPSGARERVANRRRPERALVIRSKSPPRLGRGRLERLEPIAGAVARPRRYIRSVGRAGPREARPVTNHVARELSLVAAQSRESQQGELEQVLHVRAVIGAARKAQRDAGWKRRVCSDAWRRSCCSP